MLTFPKDKQAAITLCRSMTRLKLTNDPIIGLFNEQLAALDKENRTELHETVFKQRQGAAQAISETLDFINKSKDEAIRLEGIT